MKLAAQKWPHLNGSLVGLSSESELVDILMINSTQDPPGVCQQEGRAGGESGDEILYPYFSLCSILYRYLFLSIILSGLLLFVCGL